VVRLGTFINKKGGYIQRSRQAENDPPLGAARGLAYGPDGTLYVFDRGTIVAYEVWH
jgi:hypothetical protein